MARPILEARSLSGPWLRFAIELRLASVSDPKILNHTLDITYVTYVMCVCVICIVSRMLPVAPESYPGRWALDSKLVLQSELILFLLLHLKLNIRRLSVFQDLHNLLCLSCQLQSRVWSQTGIAQGSLAERFWMQTRPVNTHNSC